MTSEPNTDAMQASLRELRLVLERMIQVGRPVPGLTVALREAALAALALGLVGFDALEGHVAALAGETGAGARLETDGPEPTIDVGGGHAWAVAEAVLDVAVDLWRRTGAARVRVTGLAHPEQIGVVRVLAEKHLVAAEVTLADGIATLALAPSRVAPQATLDRIRRDGLTVERALWWRLFHKANEALAPDSFESRRHAGPIMVAADGRILGRNDEDDTDLSLLAAGLAGTLPGRPAAAPSDE